MDQEQLEDLLREMNQQLAAMIQIADRLEDPLLGALLCDAHGRLTGNYAEVLGA